MADSLRRRSALAHRARASIDDASGSGRIRIELSAAFGFIHLRLPPDDEGLAAAVQAALGGELPRAPNATQPLRSGHAHWLGPDEWLAAVAEADAEPLLRALEERTRDRFAAVTDVTDAKAAFLLSGPAAADVLRKGCPIDVHHSVFTSGRCAQTMLAKASVLVICIAPDARYTVIADRSEADYVWRWLEDAALEFTSAPGRIHTTQEEGK